jgi:cysteine synthase A
VICDELYFGLAIIMPDDVAAEKELALHALGAHVEKVRPASFVDKKQVMLIRHPSLNDN